MPHLPRPPHYMLHRTLRLVRLLTAPLVLFALTVSCAQVSQRPLALEELKERSDAYEPELLGRSEERIELSVTTQGQQLSVNPHYTFQRIYQYAANDYVKCRVTRRDGRVCEGVKGERYTYIEPKAGSASDAPWTLQIRASTGEVLFESEYDGIAPKAIDLSDFDACAVPGRVLWEHPDSEMMDVQVVASLRGREEPVRKVVTHRLPFVTRDALAELFRDELRAHAEKPFVRVKTRGEREEFLVDIETEASMDARKRMVWEAVSTKELCGTSVTTGDLDEIWNEQLQREDLCLKGRCASVDGRISVPFGSIFTLTTKTSPAWRWRISTLDDDVEDEALGITQTTRDGGFEFKGSRELWLSLPTKYYAPTLPINFALAVEEDFLSKNIWVNAPIEKWAYSDNEFYTPPTCKLQHPTCDEQSATMYTRCQESVCADVVMDPSHDSEDFSSWRKSVRHIGGHFLTSFNAEAVRSGRLRFDRLETVEGRVGAYALLARRDERRLNVEFPRLEFTSGIHMTPDTVVGGDSARPTTYTFARLEETGTLTISGVKAGLYLNVEAPSLRRIQQTLFIGQTKLTSNRLRRLTPKLTEVGSSVVFHIVVGLDSLRGLENLRVIHGDLILMGVRDLKSLDGLRNLECVKGSIVIAGNNNLTSLSGLRSLKSVGSPSCGAEDEDSMEIAVQIRDNPNLRSLKGLESMGNINGVVEVSSNPKLTDIRALARTAANGFLLRWGTGIRRTDGVFDDAVRGESYCWIDEKTREQVGETPCFVVE